MLLQHFAYEFEDKGREKFYNTRCYDLSCYISLVLLLGKITLVPLRSTREFDHATSLDSYNTISYTNLADKKDKYSILIVYQFAEKLPKFAWLSFQEVITLQINISIHLSLHIKC